MLAGCIPQPGLKTIFRSGCFDFVAAPEVLRCSIRSGQAPEFDFLLHLSAKPCHGLRRPAISSFPDEEVVVDEVEEEEHQRESPQTSAASFSILQCWKDAQP